MKDFTIEAKLELLSPLNHLTLGPSANELSEERFETNSRIFYLPLRLHPVPVLVVTQVSSSLDVHGVSHLSRTPAHIPHKPHLSVHHLYRHKVLLRPWTQ